MYMPPTFVMALWLLASFMLTRPEWIAQRLTVKSRELYTNEYTAHGHLCVADYQSQF
jgi:hypothetical protein